VLSVSGTYGLTYDDVPKACPAASLNQHVQVRVHADKITVITDDPQGFGVPESERTFTGNIDPSFYRFSAANPGGDSIQGQFRQAGGGAIILEGSNTSGGPCGGTTFTGRNS
jgi:hypothetical protein